MRRRLTWLAVALLALAGCRERRGGAADSAAFVPSRVICATPAVAEIVFALGCGDRVVGVSEFTDWPLEAANRPTIGGALSPNRERILALEPDLILAQGKSVALEAFAKSQGIAFLALPLDTLDDLRGAISGFASALGAAEQGKALLAGMEKDFSAIPFRDPVSTFIALGHAPGNLSGLMTSGPGTFLSEIVATAGGRNVFGDVAILWPTVSQETLVRRNPAIILDFQPVPVDEARRTALVADWEKRGFRAAQIRILDEDYLLKPGPRAAQSAARIAAAMHK